MSRLVAVLALLALVAPVAACAGDDPPRVTLRMVARDGEDPLEGVARLRLELDATPPVTPEPTAVDASGFQIDLDLPDTTSLRRVRAFLEDDAGLLVSRGATPEAPLELLSGVPLRLLVSRVGAAGAVTIDTLPVLVAAAPLEDEWIVGLDDAGALTMFDLLALAPVSGVAPLTPARPGATLADLGDGRTLVVGAGEGVRVYDGRTNLWGEGGDGVETGSFATPAVLSLEGGGAVAACGGRAEVVGFGADGAVAWTAELAAVRTGCAAAIAAGALVVYGGADTDDAPAAEAVDLVEHSARTLIEAPDARFGAGAAAAGGRVLVAGGTRDGAPLADALRLDPACADGCPASVPLGAARASALALGLDDDRVLVLGGNEAPEVAALEDAQATAVPGPAADARAVLRGGTGDVWWFGPSGAGVYADAD